MTTLHSAPLPCCSACMYVCMCVYVCVRARVCVCVVRVYARVCVTDLRDDHVTLGAPPLLYHLVEDELGHLGGLAASRLPADDHHRVVVDGVQDLVMGLADGQRAPVF
jgi:hypothetical protein